MERKKRRKTNQPKALVANPTFRAEFPSEAECLISNVRVFFYLVHAIQ
jgi:hypothetical protein